MDEVCKTCEYLPRCEETGIQLCLLKDNEHVVKNEDGDWGIETDWLTGLETAE